MLIASAESLLTSAQRPMQIAPMSPNPEHRDHFILSIRERIRIPKFKTPDIQVWLKESFEDPVLPKILKFLVQSRVETFGNSSAKSNASFLFGFRE